MNLCLNLLRREYFLNYTFLVYKISGAKDADGSATACHLLALNRFPDAELSLCQQS